MAQKDAVAKTWTLPPAWNGRRYSDPANVPEEPGDLPIAPAVSATRINDTTIRFTFSGGSYATAWLGYYRAPSGSGSFSTVALTVGQASQDVTVVSAGTAQMYVVASNDFGEDFSNVADGSAAELAWQLGAGHYVETQRAPELVFPRPDSETPAWAKHRRHYPGKRFEIPLGISFGSWPFYFEAITMPAGATVGAFLTPSSDKLIVGDDYGVVRWDNPTAGTHEWHIRVHFQDGWEPLDVQWTTEVTTTGTIFVDESHPDASDSNPGTEALPMLTLDGWFKADFNDRTFSQYQVCYKAGTYDVVTADPGTAGNLRMNYLNKPLVHYACDDDVVEWDFLNTMTAAQSASVTSGGEYNWHDVFFGGIICKGGTQAATNGRRWNVNAPARGPVEYTGVGGGLRCTWFKCPQIDWTYTGDPTNNTGICFAPDTTVTTQCRQFWYVTRCPIRNILNGGLNFNGWFVGNVRRFLAEHVEVENTSFGRGPFSGKSSESLSCYRNIDLSKAPSQPFNYDNAGSYGPELGGGTEVSYCKVNRQSTGAAATAMISGHHGDAYNPGYPEHRQNVHFRNSVSKSPSATGEAFYAFAGWPVNVLKDVWCSTGDGIYLNGPQNTQAAGDWRLYSIANNPFDADMNLSGAARTELLGTHGAEVA